ncbi:hypothetical protein SFR_5073 [Streptomyces sp. FR-008]|nr:hypothetical protein SFR_5073 [Streptomyces sp. FR-008]
MGLGLGPFAGGALGVGTQPPTPLVPGAERVGHLQHHVQRSLVGALLERGPHLDQPHLEHVPQPRHTPPRVAHQVLPGVVHRPARQLHRPHQVDPAQVAEQRRVGGRAGRLQVLDRHRPVGPAQPPGGMGPVARVPHHLTVPLGQYALERRAPGAVPRRVEQPLLLPPRRPDEHPRPPGHLPRVHLLADLQRLARVGPPQHHLVRPLRNGEPHLRGVDLGAQLQRGDPVPEPPVDPRLGGGQHRERLPARPYVVELAAHHRGEDPPAPVRGRHPDHRHPGRRHRPPAGHRDPEGEGPRRPHDLRPVPHHE